ncbi:putative adhesin [Chelatococcus asaccharovorans]|uniref:Putative adhesin Stv domain-containing protein n=1 Tax=Chelatococcus asaccharovorans TaxID=28210 RepID=A0A2V3U6W8_9HYPH|nr:hypothetical protein [Chelatococcus asaccharovorans]PXW58805.1 hypothetical protein C7450_105153 [Chelatococcus asaccharovorans]CAH1657780.1 conserved hypothetical protein [Chelatococcus asaccharovorans]CAH1684693.1 conserved hypothetical protein [Chelatococcus asaccharovorans]
MFVESSCNLTANALGRHVYAWTLANDRPTPGVDTCVISSHGVRFQGSSFVRLDVDLVFYGPEGASLVEPISTDIVGVLTGAYAPYETRSGGRYPDYFLSKYQGRYETYDMLRNLPLQVAYRYSIRPPDASPPMRPHPAVIDRMRDTDCEDYQRLVERWGVWNMDVITVRHRYPKLAMRLSTLLQILYDHGYRYRTIHCDFCRSPLWLFGAPVYSPERRYTY